MPLLFVRRSLMRMDFELLEEIIEDLDEQAEVQTVPIHCKVALTIKEAAEYSNIGINKLECLLRSPRCPFVLYVGKKKFVKRRKTLNIWI